METNTVLLLSIMIFETRIIDSAHLMRFGVGVDAKTVSRLFGISLEECKEACRRRPLCQSVNYFRYNQACRMKGFVEPSSYMLLNRPRAILVLLKDYSENGKTACGQNICTENEVCNRITEKCTVEECVMVKEPDNGKVFGNLFTVGAKKMLDCDEYTYIPYDLILPLFTVCQPNGTWTSSTINCYLKCVMVKEPDNGKVFGNLFTVGAKKMLDCNEYTYIPYDLILPLFTPLKCGSEYCSWNEVCYTSTRRCYVNECPRLEKPQNGLRYGNMFTVGSKALLECDQAIFINVGIHLPGLTTCQENGQWTLRNIICNV